MITGGIDLAAQPKNTGACVIDWTTGLVEVIRGPVDDDQIVAVVKRSRRTGMDVPLGWPDEFIIAIRRHQHSGGWPGWRLEPAADRARLRLRLTDRVARSVGLNPLSVSADRIAVTAMRWARLEHQLVREGLHVDRSGCSGRVAEVYPAGSLRMWGWDPRLDTGSLVEMVVERLEFDGLRGEQAREELDGCNRHQLDACIAAITARAVLRRQTNRPAGAEREAARREGWIHLPRATP